MVRDGLFEIVEMTMSITIGDEYFAVHIETPTLKMIRWRNEHPVKIPGTKKSNEVYWAKQRAANAAAREKYTRDYATLKAAGLHEERRFQYEETAKKWAAQVEAETGVKVEVSKQCDLYLWVNTPLTTAPGCETTRVLNDD